jgi:3-(3-hydroxy-phenyl)propionate hydroxylase
MADEPFFAAIVGGGPVGFMLANLLGDSGAPVCLLEKRTSPHTVPRAISYDAETLRLFQKIGLYSALEPTLILDVPVTYYNQSGRTLFRMGKAEQPYGHSQIGSFYQPELEAVLRDGVKRYANVDIRIGATVTGIKQFDDHATVEYTTVDGEVKQIAARYVIGCDGGSSFVRGAANISFGGQSFDEQWLVIDCEDEGYGLGEVQFFCDPRRPALTVPVSKGRRRWEFLVMPGDDPEALVSEHSVRALIRHYAPADSSRIERAIIYTFHARYADRFRNDRILLAGDAAHISPPFAGQGLNSGFRDAQNLAWRLDLIYQGKSTDRLLDSYEVERLPHVRALTIFSIRLGQAVMPITQAKAKLRDALFTMLTFVPGVKGFIDRGGLIPKPRLPKLAVRGKHRKTGHMVVQPMVKNSGGDHPVMLDTLLGSGWAVIGVDANARTGLHPDDFALCDCLNAALISLKAEDAPALAQQIGRGKLAIVRPDRYIAEIFSPAATRPALAWLHGALALIQNEKA